MRFGLHAAATKRTAPRQLRTMSDDFEFGILLPNTNGTQKNPLRGAVVVTHLTT
jgi:hypothetical protein